MSGVGPSGFVGAGAVAAGGAAVDKASGAVLPVPAAGQASAADGGPAYPSSTKTLILYDTGGQWGDLGELYASMTANLTSNFGSWTAKPVSSLLSPPPRRGPLRRTVEGIKALGYTFVSPTTL